MNKDRIFLKELAKGVRNELCSRHLSQTLRLCSKLLVEDASSDGWYITVGRFSGYATSADVWIDRFAGYRDRKIYYGAVASRPEGITKLVKKLSGEFDAPLLVTDEDQRKGSKYTCMARPLPKSKFGHPIYEKYTEKGEKEYFYGMYVFDHTGLQRDKFARLVDRISDFFQTIVKTLNLNHSDASAVYSGVENRKLVLRHILRERDSHIATLRKQKDNFICKICGFDFSKVYGKLGKNFAEAHHRIPLNTNNLVRKTTIDDLITVCPNCHRMLHRMTGSSSDVQKLQKLL